MEESFRQLHEQFQQQKTQSQFLTEKIKVLESVNEELNSKYLSNNISHSLFNRSVAARNSNKNSCPKTVH